MLIAWATIFCNNCCRLSLNNCVIFILKQNDKKNLSKCPRCFEWLFFYPGHLDLNACGFPKCIFVYAFFGWEGVVCMYVCMYMCVCMCVYICVCVYIYIYIYVCIYIYIDLYLFLYMNVSYFFLNTLLCIAYILFFWWEGGGIYISWFWIQHQMYLTLSVLFRWWGVWLLRLTCRNWLEGNTVESDGVVIIPWSLFPSRTEPSLGSTHFSTITLCRQCVLIGLSFLVNGRSDFQKQINVWTSHSCPYDHICSSGG